MIQTPDFDALYERDPDPWQVHSSFYEQRKLTIVLACLKSSRYRFAWDPACGVGALAARLAERTDRLLASDASPQAVALTERYCHDLEQVTVRGLALPEAPPEDLRGFDLVVLSEFFYYLSEPDRAAAITMIDAVTTPDAEIVSVHWRYRPHDAWLSGEDVQTEVIDRLATLGWRHQVQHDDRDFVVDCLERDR